MICTYNSDLVKNLGLHTAIMLSLIQEQYISAKEKGLLKENKFFLLDKNCITKNTGFTQQEQESILKSLIKWGVVQQQTKKELFIISYDETFDTEDCSGYKYVDKLTQKELERSAKIKFLRTKIETQNTELLQAYFDWIDAAYDKNGWLAPKSVEVAQRLIDSFTNRDLDIALDILTIATMGGYRDMEWAINTYKDKSRTLPKVKTTITQQTNSRLTDEVF